MIKEEQSIEIRESEYKRRFAMVMATAWRDENFRKRLNSEPNKCLEEFGITVPKGKKVIVHFEKEDETHIVIPSSPPSFGEPIEMNSDDKCWKSSKCWNLCD